MAAKARTRTVLPAVDTAVDSSCFLPICCALLLSAGVLRYQEQSIDTRILSTQAVTQIAVRGAVGDHAGIECAAGISGFVRYQGQIIDTHIWGTQAATEIAVKNTPAGLLKLYSGAQGQQIVKNVPTGCCTLFNIHAPNSELKFHHCRCAMGGSVRFYDNPKSV